jgi:hypothetical protein
LKSVIVFFATFTGVTDRFLSWSVPTLFLGNDTAA